ncbi:MAG: acyltransferase domain-containing protein [Legionella sp.]|nr:acyltransferase domain-containing protein [Legionella sp.]
MRNIVFLISGQGSQYYQMGFDLYCENEIFHKKMHTLDEIIRERFGFSIIDVIYNQKKGVSEAFDDPVYSSLGIYLIEYALASTLANYGVKPAKIIGSSLGMFVASVLAQCIDEVQGLEIIYSLMNNIKNRCTQGGMIAVLADPGLYHNSHILKNNSVLAAIDPGFSFVLSMQASSLSCVEPYLKKMNVGFQCLPVSRAYHSHHMEPIKNDFLNINLTFSSKTPFISLICCAKTDELKTVQLSDLWYAVRQPLLFTNTITRIEDKMTSCYVDIGPSGMMATYLKYILPKNSKSEVYTILSPYKQASKNFLQVVDRCTTIENNSQFTLVNPSVSGLSRVSEIR